jgi:hypothetical protein
MPRNPHLDSVLSKYEQTIRSNEAAGTTSKMYLNNNVSNRRLSMVGTSASARRLSSRSLGLKGNADEHTVTTVGSDGSATLENDEFDFLVASRKEGAQDPFAGLDSDGFPVIAEEETPSSATTNPSRVDAMRASAGRRTARRRVSVVGGSGLPPTSVSTTSRNNRDLDAGGSRHSTSTTTSVRRSTKTPESSSFSGRSKSAGSNEPDSSEGVRKPRGIHARRRASIVA